MPSIITFKRLSNCFSMLFLVFTFLSCGKKNKKREVVLYQNYCASCHIAPQINDLPKHIWEASVLPAMAARMGIRTEENHPYKNLSFNEQAAIIKSGIYPTKPIIALKDWELLKKYIISMAPEKLPNNNTTKTSMVLTGFKEIPLAIDAAPGANITYLDFNEETTKIVTGSMKGDLLEYDYNSKANKYLGLYRSPISDVQQTDKMTLVTAMGSLIPTEISTGFIAQKDTESTRVIITPLHRPVHTLMKDLNNNGSEELIISEFGDLGGKLTLWTLNTDSTYTSVSLLNQPGIIRVVAADMNDDGKQDLVVLTSQGDEGVTILYQTDDLKFSAEKVLRFSPVYGTSWFELVDYDGDGDKDLITVHGDNADESYVQKPYHGMRIHLNNGANSFKEAFFFPLNGATRIIVKDFDKDSDMDIALIASFPDYELKPEYSFVYLENKNSTAFDFEVQTLNNPSESRWFLMDSGDIDKDGDDDIILSAFTYPFTPVPKDLEMGWNKKNTDILVLENSLH